MQNKFIFTYRVMERERSHSEVLQLMIDAERLKVKIKGVKGFSPLACLDMFDLVWSFSFDYMHTVLLGILKDLLNKYATIRDCIKPGMNYVQSINNLLRHLKSLNEMTRSLESALIQECQTWKANQLRSFLFLVGPVVLKDVLKNEFYRNFMELSQAIFIFNQQKITEADFNIASQKLFHFINGFENLFGEESMTYNIHLLNHLPMCILKLGPLHSYSLFAFEGKNHFLNNYISGTHNVIQEATSKIALYQNRFLGIRFNSSKSLKVYLKIDNIVVTSKPRIASLSDAEIFILGHRDAELFEIKHFYKDGILYKSFDVRKISNKKCDSNVITTDGKVGCISKILISNNLISIILTEPYRIINSDVQLISLQKNVRPSFFIIECSKIDKKVLVFEEKLICTFMPNSLESD
jgi:hypothetical protein